MKKLNTQKGAGNTHAQTETYVTGVSLFAQNTDSYDYQMLITSTDPQQIIFPDLFKLPEVIKALAEKDLTLHPAQVVLYDVSVSTSLNGKEFKYHIYKIFFISPKENAVSAILIDIDSNGKANRECTALKRKPYIPETTTDVIQANSLELSRNYTASELINLSGLTPEKYQLLSFTAKEGNGTSIPDEFKYTLYLMRK